MKLSRVGIDLAKNVYQLHGVDRLKSPPKGDIQDFSRASGFINVGPH